MAQPPHEGRRAMLDVLKAVAQATPFTAVAAALMEAADEHKNRRWQYFVDQLLQAWDEELTGLYDRVSPERIADLVEHGTRAAEGARTKEKLRLLARIVASGSNPGATATQVDRAHFLLDIVANLEPPHMEVLQKLAEQAPQGPDYDASVVGGWTARMLSQALPHLDDLAPVALAALAGQGLVMNAQLGAAIAPESWRLTEPGAWVLARLRELGQT